MKLMFTSYIHIKYNLIHDTFLSKLMILPLMLVVQPLASLLYSSSYLYTFCFETTP